MKKIEVTHPQIKLVGISSRTNNMSEMNPMTAKILPTLQRYGQEKIASHIPHKKNEGVTFCAYTQYESDYLGDYTYFVGEEVTSFENVPDTLDQLTIPIQVYAKFTSEPGIMPAVCIHMWQKIWQEPEILGGKRTYHTDFEVYDKRALDPTQAVLDIYVGIHPS